jgi:hypothetical protein
MTEQSKAYSDTLNVGDILFPMLYIYYMGNDVNKRRVGNTYKFEDGLKTAFQNAFNYAADDIETIIKQFDINIVRYYHMIASAAVSNPIWLWEMNNAVVNVMERYKSRMPQIRGQYYEGSNGSGTSYSPILNSGDVNNLFNMMETLRILFENDLIPADFNLGTRPISLYTGKHSDDSATVNANQKMSRLLGVPIQGQFHLNSRSTPPMMGKTFTGVDMKTIITLNQTVTMIESMTSFSWSVHRGKPTGRPLGKAGPSGRGKGSRTIAGTMVFAVSDHEPLLDIIPATAPSKKLTDMGWNNTTYRKVMMPDQLPPFDVMIMMKNEYGNYAISSIYGIEIVDYGGTQSIDNMINEHVYQYTAVAMDPLVEAYPDENGFLDPYGLLQGGYSSMWMKREAAIEGVLHSDLEDMYFSDFKAATTSFKTPWN